MVSILAELFCAATFNETWEIRRLHRTYLFTYHYLLSNPLDSQKTKLLKTKTVDFSINNNSFH